MVASGKFNESNIILFTLGDFVSIGVVTLHFALTIFLQLAGIDSLLYESNVAANVIKQSPLGVLS